jgi:hypothetical protein
MAGGSYVRSEDGVMREPEGHAALWGVFGLSRASWLVMPRSLMHEMPDDWQARMAELLNEYFATYTNMPNLSYEVKAKRGGKFVSLPNWVEYRRPDVTTIQSFKAYEANR